MVSHDDVVCGADLDWTWTGLGPTLDITRQQRDGLDLDEEIVAREPRNLNQGAGRTRIAEIFLADFIDLRTIADVADEDGHLADIGERGPDRGQALFEIFMHLPRLRGDVALADGVSILVFRLHSGNEHHPSGTHDRAIVTDRLGNPRDLDLLTPFSARHRHLLADTSVAHCLWRYCSSGCGSIAATTSGLAGICLSL